MATLRDDELTAMGKIGCIAAAAPVLTVIAAAVSLWLAFVNGFVLSHIWTWHAVPLGMRPIGWPTFAALMLCRSLLRAGAKSGAPDDSSTDRAEKVTAAVLVLVWPWVVMLLAYLIR